MINQISNLIKPDFEKVVKTEKKRKVNKSNNTTISSAYSISFSQEALEYLSSLEEDKIVILDRTILSYNENLTLNRKY